MPHPLSGAAQGRVPRPVARGIDRLLSVHRPVVLAHLRQIRSSHPNASPAEVVAILEKRYLTAVTTGGAAVGAAAAIPAVGTATSVALSGAEAAGFLETSALFAQSITELHGIPTDDAERVRTLVMTMILGSGGVELIEQVAGQAAGGAARPAFWGELVTKAMPAGLFSQVTDRIKHAFVRRFATSQGASIVGRAIPFGIGAVIGGTGNHLLGRRVVQASRTAFGPPPATFPESLTLVVKAPKPRKSPRSGEPSADPASDVGASGRPTPRLPRAPKWAKEPDPQVKRMLASGRPPEV